MELNVCVGCFASLYVCAFYQFTTGLMGFYCLCSFIRPLIIRGWDLD
jgi:hypothetical protein